MACVGDSSCDATFDLRMRPWKPLRIISTLSDNRGSQRQNGTDHVDIFVFKCRFNNDSYDILLSDLTNVWQECMSQADVKTRSELLNPSVEAPISKLLAHIHDSLDDSRADTVLEVLCGTTGDRQGKLLLAMQTKLAGLPFVWQFNASLASNTMVTQHFTQPLLCMVGEMERQQREAFQLLRDKDKEIADLTAQGTKVSRKHLQTAVFDEDIFITKMLASEEFKQEVESSFTGIFPPHAEELYTAVTSQLATRSNKQPVSENEVTTETVMSEVPTEMDSSLSELSQTKDSEMSRREELERRLSEQHKKDEAKKKRKKIKF